MKGKRNKRIKAMITKGQGIEICSQCNCVEKIYGRDFVLIVMNNI